MKRTVILFAAIAISMVMSVSSEAQEKRLALIIGNAAYKNAPLKNPVNDANDMEKTLRQVGFDVIARVDATQQDMEEIIQDFGKKLSKTDVGLFYFSGHGVQYKGENYLIPINDTGLSESNIKYKTVPLGIVLEELTNAGNHLNIVILDACRDYPPSWRRSKSTVRGLAQMKAGSGMLIAYATSPDSTASDGSGRNGTYTANLLKYMTSPDLHLLMFFQEVRKATLIDSNNQQRPWESVSIVSDFYFVGNPTKPIQSSNIDSNSTKTTEQASVSVQEKTLLEDNRDGTITDHKTGLMWQKSGSVITLSHIEAERFVEELNRKEFVGYNDWRLPKINELRSLLAKDKQSNNLFINPIFDSKQSSCWSSSTEVSVSLFNNYSWNAWLMSFKDGYPERSSNTSYNYVRAVRSMQKTK